MKKDFVEATVFMLCHFDKKFCLNFAVCRYLEDKCLLIFENYGGHKKKLTKFLSGFLGFLWVKNKHFLQFQYSVLTNGYIFQLCKSKRIHNFLSIKIQTVPHFLHGTNNSYQMYFNKYEPANCKSYMKLLKFFETEYSL